MTMHTHGVRVIELTGDERTDLTLDLLGLVLHPPVDRLPAPEELAQWTDGMHALARRWAAAVHLSASDNGNRVPTKPAFLDGDDAEAWAVAWWNGVDVFTMYDASGNPSFVAGNPYDGGDPDLARAGGLVVIGDIPPGWAISIEETRPDEAATVQWVAACPRGKAKGGAR